MGTDAAHSRAQMLDRALRPRAVAVLGASAREGALSGRFISGLLRHEFQGRTVPVNPRYDEVQGLRCYPSVTAAVEDGEIDLAILSLPQRLIYDAVAECAEAGLAGVVIFASGFSEVGPEGAAEERRIAELAERVGIRVIGPNSPGFINFGEDTCVIASGVSFRESFRSGGIAHVAQSGGVAGLVVERAQDAGAGLSVALCTGNEADLTVGEALWWLVDHEPTKVVTLFLEGIRSPELLAGGLDALRAAGKPVIALKGGATDVAARASAAHTGALASVDDVVDAFLARHGVIRVDGFDELIDHAVALERLGPTPTKSVGILTTSGGASIVAAEAAERAGLQLPEPSAETNERLRAAMPDFAAIGNPADMSGMFSEEPEIFRNSLRIVAEAPEFGTAVMVLTVHPPRRSDELAELILSVGAPNLAVLWTAGRMAAPARERLMGDGVAVFEDARRCMDALAARTRFNPDAGGAPLAPAAVEPLASTSPTEAEALAALGAAGVPVARTVVCADAEAAGAAASDMGSVVVKASAPDLPHKSDASAVVVGVSGAEAVGAAHEQVVAAALSAGAHPEGSIVQELAGEGIELIVGARRDPVLGPVLVVGPGGIQAELSSEVARRLLPLRPGEAREMLEDLPVTPLLHGYRGGPAADLDAAAAAIESLAAVVVAVGDRLDALEVNPLLVHPQGEGATAVDALLLLEG